MGKGDESMPTRLEKEVCKEYNLSPRKISDKQILDIMELIIINYGTLELRDLESQDSDGFYVEVPLDRKYQVYDHDYDERPAENVGYSDNLRNTILNLLCCEQIRNSLFLHDDIQYLLMNRWERFKETIWG